MFPRSTEDVAAIVKIAREFQVPLVGRGAGTGLSGGAIPREGGIMVALRAHEPHPGNRPGERARRGASRAWSTWISRWRCESSGYFYAPDPSSQRACTIGGNVAENAGGPHTLAYGVTTNHVLGLELVLPDGTVVETGGKEPDLPGYDLTGLLTGSEGTMALVTKVTVRLMRKPETVKTMLAIYESQRGRRPHGGRNHRARHHAGGRGDAGRRDAAHGGGGHPRRLSAWTPRRCC